MAPELTRADTNEAPTADDDRLEKAPARLDELLEARAARHPPAAAIDPLNGRRRTTMATIETDQTDFLSRMTARWVAPFFAAAALVLVPWIVVLATRLPATHAAPHWNLTWAGFDVALTLLLIPVAAAAWRHSPWLEGAATAAAALLLADAWFDVTTLRPESNSPCRLPKRSWSSCRSRSSASCLPATRNASSQAASTGARRTARFDRRPVRARNPNWLDR